MDVIDADWIRQRLTGAWGEQSRLAEAMGIDKNKMSRILAGERRVQAVEIPKVLQFFADLEKETGPLKSDKPDRAAPRQPSMGYIQGDSDGPFEGISLPQKYLKSLTDSPRDRLRVITAEGDSMEPTLRERDLVLIDLDNTDANFEGLFALHNGPALQIKRLIRSAKPNHVQIISDNRAIYPPIDIARDDIDVLGRVIWYGREA